jgi:hypothetical protein
MRFQSEAAGEVFERLSQCSPLGVHPVRGVDLIRARRCKFRGTRAPGYHRFAAMASL